jgi:phosphoenolpyruvate carboxykinase (ATP)
LVPLPPAVYGTLLGDKLGRHGCEAWLVNTGWSGGPFGVGQRMRIAHTRAMVHAILDGSLHGVPFETEPNFGLAVPTACPNVPNEILDPRDTWADKEAYDAQARKLAAMFADNFRDFAAGAPPEVRAAGPHVC